MKALKELYQVSFEQTELPRLAQKVENLIVGAPCGLMDQLASYFGKSRTLLPILCQPDILYSPISIPENIHFVGIDSGVRHSVGGASYSDVRTAAFMGYSMIAKEMGISQERLAEAKETGDFSQLPYKGYLANITPAEFEAKFSLRLLYKMAGQYFVRYFPVHIDSVTSVDPEKFYAVLDCTRHPVYENFRVQTFMLLLQYVSEATDGHIRRQCLQQLGELMYQSHTSYSICGLGDVHTDELVEMVKQQKGKGVYGAKITGGGSGGTVCILCEGEEGLQTARNIHHQYQEKHSKQVMFFE
jgi:L-arabinokinase